MSESIPADRPFEEALLELERLVQNLEDGQLGLDDALARYEQGVALIKQCHGQLRQAEQRILVLTGMESVTPGDRALVRDHALGLGLREPSLALYRLYYAFRFLGAPRENDGLLHWCAATIAARRPPEQTPMSAVRSLRVIRAAAWRAKLSLEGIL